MNLFQSEWLREPPRPSTGTYAGTTYGARYERARIATAVSEPAPAAIDLRFLAVPAPAPRRRPVASFDRAA